MRLLLLLLFPLFSFSQLSIGILESSRAGYDADAQAFITAAGITDATQKTAINNLVVGLKADGLWTKAKAIYPFVGGTASSHKWNLKDPRDLDAAYRLIFGGGWTHSSTGALGNGSNTYADTKYFINDTSISMGSYIRTNNAAADMAEMGIYSGPYNNSFIAARWSDGINYTFINISSGAGAITYTNTNSQGFYVANRPNKNLLNAWKNGVKQGTNTTIYSSNAATHSLYIGAYNSAGITLFISNRQTAFAFIMLGLTDTEAANLYTRVQAFQTALSRQI